VIIPNGTTFTSVIRKLGDYIFMLRDGGEALCTEGELNELNSFLLSIGLLDDELVPTLASDE